MSRQLRTLTTCHIPLCPTSARLKEIGPRMTLTLVKILDGFCAGDSLYHKFDTLTDEQKAEIVKRRTERK